MSLCACGIGLNESGADYPDNEVYRNGIEKNGIFFFDFPECLGKK
jgi:hypothetical protein